MNSAPHDSWDWLNEFDSAGLALLTPEEQNEFLALTAPQLWEPQTGPQTEAYRSQADIVGYGGAAGGGKTDLLLGLALTQHTRSIIFRREAKQLRAITDRARELLGPIGRFNEVLGIWRDLPGGRQMEFGGVKDAGDEQAYRGRPHDFIGFDEADQFLEFQVRFLQGWLRTTNREQRCRVVMGFNPPASAEGRWLLQFFGPWVDEKHPKPALPGELRWYATLADGTEVERPDGQPFLDGKLTVTPKSRTFIPAHIDDNIYLRDTGYIATLQALPEPLRSQLLRGDFSAGIQDDAWQVIPTAWVKAAQARWTPAPPPGQGMTCIGADVARGGADFTVPVLRYGPWIAPPKKYQGTVTDDGPKAARLILRDHDRKCPVFIDAIGLGASAYDAAKVMIDDDSARRAVAVNVSQASERTDRSGKYRLMNVRAELWWTMREALDPDSGQNIMLPPGNEVLADLTAPRFEVIAAGLKIEEKKKIKERINRSPDVGDAIALTFKRPKSPAFMR